MGEDPELDELVLSELARAVSVDLLEEVLGIVVRNAVAGVVERLVELVVAHATVPVLVEVTYGLI